MISGTVVDGETGEILTGASVVLSNGQAIQRTDQLGNFRFDNLRAGRYKITVTFIGYLPYTTDISLTENETRSLNLYYHFGPKLQVYIKNGMGFHSNDARVVVAENALEVLPKAYGTDVGIFAKPLPNLFLNIAIWQLRLEQEFVYVGDEAVVEMSGETQRYGVDLSIRYQLTDWLFLDFDGNYAYGRSLTDPEGQNFIPLAPVLTSIGSLSASWPNGFKAAIRYRYVGDRPANEDNTVRAEGYFLLDGGLSYTKGKLQIGANATNLLNEEWNEAQFDTRTRLAGEAAGISELTFTPGYPLFIKTAITFSF